MPVTDIWDLVPLKSLNKQTVDVIRKIAAATNDILPPVLSHVVYKDEGVIDGEPFDRTVVLISRRIQQDERVDGLLERNDEVLKLLESLGCASAMDSLSEWVPVSIFAIGDTKLQQKAYEKWKANHGFCKDKLTIIFAKEIITIIRDSQKEAIAALEDDVNTYPTNAVTPEAVARLRTDIVDNPELVVLTEFIYLHPALRFDRMYPKGYRIRPVEGKLYHDFWTLVTQSVSAKMKELLSMDVPDTYLIEETCIATINVDFIVTRMMPDLKDHVLARLPKTSAELGNPGGSGSGAP